MLRKLLRRNNSPAPAPAPADEPMNFAETMASLMASLADFQSASAPARSAYLADRSASLKR